MDAALATDEVDVDDVGVVQMGGGLHLAPEPLELLGIERPGKGQHLQGNAPAEGDLLPLEDNAHTAPADFSNEPEVSEVTQKFRSSGTWVVVRQVSRAGPGHRPHGREELTKDTGNRWTAADVVLDEPPLATVDAVQELIGRLGDERLHRFVYQCDGFHSWDSVRPVSARSWCSRSRARPCRLRAVAGSISRR